MPTTVASSRMGEVPASWAAVASGIVTVPCEPNQPSALSRTAAMRKFRSIHGRDPMRVKTAFAQAFFADGAAIPPFMRTRQAIDLLKIEAKRLADIFHGGTRSIGNQ